MKAFRPRSVLLLALVALTLAGGPPTRAATADDPSMGVLQADLRSMSFEKRDAFKAAVTARVARLDTAITELTARQANEPATAERKRAMESLKAARADLEEKLGYLANVSAETWVTVRDQILAALTRIQAAYDNAQAA